MGLSLRLNTDGEADRMGIAMAMAIGAHLILLTVGFSSGALDDVLPDEPMLDIVLVNTRSDAPNPDADFLAQSNQQGSGTLDEAVKPADILPMPMANETQISLPEPEPMEASPADPEQRIITTVQPAPNTPSAPEQPNQQADQPSITEVINMGIQMTRLSADVASARQAMAKAPRRAYVSASTKEYRFATYMHAWTQKVERVGNLNYPDEALRKKLTGRLRLEVLIGPDGSIIDMIVRESSGHQILDDSAKRIVRLASPYQPFSADIRTNTDVLHITRTWIFKGDISINNE
jgi:periplasmic protein TonB